MIVMALQYFLTAAAALLTFESPAEYFISLSHTQTTTTFFPSHWSSYDTEGQVICLEILTS